MRTAAALSFLILAACGLTTSPAHAHGTLLIRPIPEFIVALGEPIACLKYSRDYEHACYAALGEIANSAIQSGSYAVARSRLTQMLSIHENAALYNDRAAANLQLELYEEALADSAKALFIDPHLMNSHVIHTNALVRVGRYQEALASVECWIAYAPDDVNAWTIRTRLFRNLGKERDAYASALYVNMLRASGR